MHKVAGGGQLGHKNHSFGWGYLGPGVSSAVVVLAGGGATVAVLRPPVSFGVIYRIRYRVCGPHSGDRTLMICVRCKCLVSL